MDYNEACCRYCSGYLSYLETYKTLSMKKRLMEMVKDNLKLINKLFEVEKYFTKKKYIGTVELARELFERGQFDLCEQQLEKLPTNSELLENLVEKLRGKSVYKTLKQIQEGKVENDLTTLKGLMSLGTHIVIECEQGNMEYRILLPNLLEKIGEMIYEL